MRRILVLLFLLSFNEAINAASFTAVSSGDWSDSNTWDQGSVPTATDDVFIKGDAIVTLDVSNAVCANINLGSNSNPNKGNGTILFNSGSVLTSSGIITFGDGGKNGYLDMTSGGTLYTNQWSGKKGSLTPGLGKVVFTGTLTLQNSSSFSSFQDLEIRGDVTLSKDITVNGDLTLTSGELDPEKKGIELKGDWINAGGSFDEGSHTNEVVTFNGSALQMIDGGETFNKVVINNTAGVGLSSGSTTIDNLMTFTDGILDVGTENLIFDYSATASGMSNVSHISTSSTGEVRRLWNASSSSTFEFPLGDGVNYSPFGITVNSASNYFPGAYVKAQLVNSKEPNHTEDDYISKYWVLSANNILNANYDWQATYSNSDVNNSESDVYGYQWDGVSWTEFNAVDASNNQLSGSGASSAISSNSSFTGKGGLVTLPVELISFEAVIKGNTTVIEWVTGSEINNEKFIVEKSVDGQVFTTIEEIRGAGNSVEKIEYSSIDHQLSLGATYYRIRQIDFDGTESVSNVQQVIYRKGKSFSVYPNPVAKGGQLNVKGEGIISVRIFDVQGQLIETFYQDYGKSMLQTPALKSGSYIATIHNEAGSHTVKVIVR